MAGRKIGIDLGTTNSCVAVMEGGVPQVIPNQEGARTTPSVVGFTAKGERLVGQIAKRQALTNPKNTVFAVKRLMGRKFDSNEVGKARQFLPYSLVQAPNGDVHVQIDANVYSTPEISSFVLQKLKAAAEDYLGQAVDEAIVTVPAYFNDPQRQATKDAGLIAGLKVLRIINEPTAAALAYGLKNAEGQFVAIYDLGGGTFDITILEMSNGLFQVKATGGDTFLGGEDFDQRIVDWLLSEFQREVAIDLKQDRMALQRMKEAAEKAKCELSTSQQTEIVLPFISADASGPRHLNTVLTRQMYESLTNDLLEKTVEPCRRCLADAQLRAEQIDEVLLVGGQTRAPKVAEIVRKVFGKEPNRAINPDEGVAMGAAIQTGILEGEVKDLVLLDVTPHTLGIETKDGTFTVSHRPQLHNPYPQEPGVHDRRGQPDASRGACASGRERPGRVQHEPGQVRAHEHPPRAQGRPPDRGHVRDRCKRDRHRRGPGPGHGTRSEHDHPSLRRPQPGRGRSPGDGNPWSRPVGPRQT